MKNNISLLIIVALVVALLFVGGCNKQLEIVDTTINIGYERDSFNIASPIFMACKAEVNEFALNNVVLIVSYGRISDVYEEDSFDPGFKLYLHNIANNEDVLIKELPLFGTAAYECSYEMSGNIAYMKYAHEEEVCFPESIFLGDKGEINLVLSGWMSPSYCIESWIAFNYEKTNNNTIKLSVKYITY